MDLKLDDLSPLEMKELERNVFLATLEQIKGMGAKQFVVPDDIWSGLLCD